ncbi:MAG: DMT family transporter [Calditrichaceae bacterium]
MTKQISKTRADLLLLSVTVFWGTTFIISKLTLESVPLQTFLAIRLSLAAFFMTLIAIPHRKLIDRSTVTHGAILGIFLFISYLFQMWGIQHTSASNAGFITGLSVVFVPAFGILFFRAHPRLNSLAGVALATAGLLLLSGGNPLKWNYGDYLVLVCTFSVTFHVILTGKYARLHNIYVLTAVQLIAVSILSLSTLPFSESPGFIPTTIYLYVLLYLALFGTVYTFLMQTAMQRFTTATRTALVFSMEPVFAALFAFLIAGEILPFTGWLGGLLIVFGMITAEINWTFPNTKPKNSDKSPPYE